MITLVIASVIASVITFMIAGERFDDRNAIARSLSVHRR